MLLLVYKTIEKYVVFLFWLLFACFFLSTICMHVCLFLFKGYLFTNLSLVSMGDNPIFGKVFHAVCLLSFYNCCCLVFAFFFRFVAEYSKVNKIYLLSTFDGFIFAAIELH